MDLTKGVVDTRSPAGGDANAAVAIDMYSKKQGRRCVIGMFMQARKRNEVTVAAAGESAKPAGASPASMTAAGPVAVAVEADSEAARAAASSCTGVARK